MFSFEGRLGNREGVTKSGDFGVFDREDLEFALFLGECSFPFVEVPFLCLGVGLVRLHGRQPGYLGQKGG